KPADFFLITDPETPLGVVEATRAALSAAPPGRVAVQLRKANLSIRELVGLAHALKEVAEPRAVPLLIEDRADVARVVFAAGVCLTEDGLTPDEARLVMGTDAVVGLTCHTGADLGRAVSERADYVTLGPFAEAIGGRPAIGREGFAAIA